MKDFAPVALVAVQPNILVVHPIGAGEFAYRTDFASRSSNPGKLNYASSGAGAAAHLAGELFKTMAGVDIVHVPYKGAQPALTDLIAGHAQLMFATSASVIPYMKAGRLRALAVTTAQRSPSVPDLPTVSEAGLAGFEATTWHGVVVPAATPSALVQQLNQDINAVLKEKDLSERLADSAPRCSPARRATSPTTSRARSRSGARWSRTPAPRPIEFGDRVRIRTETNSDTDPEFRSELNSRMSKPA